jgi:hypothetical protein
MTEGNEGWRVPALASPWVRKHHSVQFDSITWTNLLRRHALGLRTPAPPTRPVQLGIPT